MRILQVIQKKQLRGAEVFACQLSNQLQAMGHQVKMVALLDGDATMPFNGEVEVLGINHEARMTDIKGWRKLNDLVDGYQPDIVQANAGDTLKYAAFSRKLFGWKAKLVFRNANKMSAFLNARWKVIFNNWLMREVDFVASVSEECNVDFTKTFQWSKTRIATLPIGVNKPVEADSNPLSEKGLSDKYPVLLHVAGFVPEKNHKALIRIVDSVRQTYPGTLLVMIGEGKLKPAIEDLCCQKGMEENVWFAGTRSDVPAFMQHASALVMPSLIEGLPGVILEAFANKLPVVANNVGGIKEVLKHKQTGWLIDKDDEPSFASNVIDLLAINDAALQTVLQNAYHLVSNAYQNDVIASKFETVYMKILAKKNPEIH